MKWIVGQKFVEYEVSSGHVPMFVDLYHLAIAIMILQKLAVSININCLFLKYVCL